MKRLNSKELRSLNECAYHTMSNEQLDESILGTIGKGLFKVAKGTGKAAVKGAGEVAKSLPGKAGRVARARAGARAIKTQAQAQQKAVAQTKALADRESLIQDALNASRNTPMSARDAAARIRAERAVAKGNLDDAEMALGLRQPTAEVAASGGSGLATGVAAGTGAAVGSAGGGQQGFLSKQFGEVEDAALAGAAENLFGDIKRTFTNAGRAVGSRSNVQQRFRGLR